MLLTPTEQRFFDLLKDGRPHSVTELQRLLWDELSTVGTVRAHVSHLRAKLERRGYVLAASRSMYILTMLTLDSAS